jgi:hypothetical protein
MVLEKKQNLGAEETIGDDLINPPAGCFSYEQIQTFFRSTNAEDQKFVALKQHLQTCKQCGGTFNFMKKNVSFPPHTPGQDKEFPKEIWKKAK